MADPLFDMRALALRRRRAEQKGQQLFLAERAVEDIAERLSFVQRRFGRGLLLGCPSDRLAEPLVGAAEQMVMAPTLDDLAGFPPNSFDLLIVLGQLDTANDLQPMLLILHSLLEPDSLIVGAFAGNNSLPVLRNVMLEADRAVGGGVSPRVHPRIEASAVAPLLQDAGFTMPVVDIDRIRLRYRSLDALIADLRGMVATNVLSGRSRKPLGKDALSAARRAFEEQSDGEGTLETIEIIHFAAWTRPAHEHA